MDKKDAYWFNLWKINTKKIIARRHQEYDEWCEIHQEELDEQEYAVQNEMPSVYWCWNCQYNDCKVHIFHNTTKYNE